MVFTSDKLSHPWDVLFDAFRDRLSLEKQDLGSLFFITHLSPAEREKCTTMKKTHPRNIKYMLLSSRLRKFEFADSEVSRPSVIIKTHFYNLLCAAANITGKSLETMGNSGSSVEEMNAAREKEIKEEVAYFHFVIT